MKLFFLFCLSIFFKTLYDAIKNGVPITSEYTVTPAIPVKADIGIAVDTSTADVMNVALIVFVLGYSVFFSYEAISYLSLFVLKYSSVSL